MVVLAAVIRRQMLAELAEMVRKLRMVLILILVRVLVGQVGQMVVQVVMGARCVGECRCGRVLMIQ